MKIKVEEYISQDGSIPYKTWFDGLDSQAAAKIVTAKLRLELGNTSNVKWFDGIGEYVIDWGPGYRVYLAKDGDTLINYFVAAPSAGSRRILSGQKLCTLSIRHERKPSPQPARLKKERGDRMALTRNFKQTVIERVERDPEFAKALLDEAATLFLKDEPETARLILRDLVNATLGFEKLAELTDKPSKSLHRMLSPNGNPSMDNLAAIFGAIRARLKVDLEVHAVEIA